MAPIWKTGDPKHKVLANLQKSGSIYFEKLLARKPNRRFGQCDTLGVPLEFAKEHGYKFEQRVTLQTRSFSKRWTVTIGVHQRQSRNEKSPSVRFCGSGWQKFFAQNRLQEGDTLVFVLNVEARSEFHVHIFRPWKVHSKLRPKPVEQKSVKENSEYAASEVLPGSARTGSASHHTTSSSTSLPSFYRTLQAYNTTSRGCIEVPSSFVKMYGMPGQLKEEVEVQGIHVGSPVRVATCEWARQGKTTRLYFTGAGWKEFVLENGLKVGRQLHFTLTSPSFFVVKLVWKEAT